MKIKRSRYLKLGGAVAVLALILSLSFTSAATPATEWPSAIATVSGGRLSLWTPDNGMVNLPLADPVHAVDLTPDGGVLAATTGTPIRTAFGGVVGSVLVLRTDDLTKIARISERDPVTQVAISPDGDYVAYVKRYTELWLLDVELGTTRKLTDVQTVAPGVAGSVLFDPTFSKTAPSPTVVFGVVEKTFAGGEDDKLDNLWQVDVTGTVTRLTSLQEGPGEEDWQVLRRPEALGDGSIVYTTGSSTDNLAPRRWDAQVVQPYGSGPSSLGPVPPMTLILEARSSEMIALVWDERTGRFDLFSVSLSPDGTWTEWCQYGCDLIQDDVDAAAVAGS